jgi:hypothetical protein
MIVFYWSQTLCNLDFTKGTGPRLLPYRSIPWSVAISGVDVVLMQTHGSKDVSGWNWPHGVFPIYRQLTKHGKRGVLIHCIYEVLTSPSLFSVSLWVLYNRYINKGYREVSQSINNRLSISTPSQSISRKEKRKQTKGFVPSQECGRSEQKSNKDVWSPEIEVPGKRCKNDTWITRHW